MALGNGAYTTADNQVVIGNTSVTQTLLNGNVGIGTTSPAYLLDVSGSSRHGYRSADTHQFTGSVSISGSLNATSSWSTNALTSSYVSSSNIVGTVTSASYALSASFAPSTITASWATNALTASSLVAANSYTITNLTASNISASGTGSFGHVGIGTAVPTTPLTIITSLAQSIASLTHTAESPTVFSGLSITGKNNNTDTAFGQNRAGGSILLRNADSTAGVYSSISGQNSEFGTSAGIMFIHENSSTNQGAMSFFTRPSGSAFVEVGRFSSTGNFGIGTKSPVNRLDVVGNISCSVITASNFFGTSSWATNALTASSLVVGNSYNITNLTASNIGVSNAIINGNLTVTGSIFASLFSASNIYITSSTLTVTDNIITINALNPYQRYAGLEMYDSGSGTLSNFLWDSLNNYFFISSSDAGASRRVILGPIGEASLTQNYIPLISGSNNITSSVIYQNSGLIGIGLINPVNKLDVAGNISCSAITSSFFGTSSWATNSLTASSLVSSNSYTITNLTASNISTSATGSFGIVGIGTTAPGDVLHISSNGGVGFRIQDATVSTGGDTRITQVGQKLSINTYSNGHNFTGTPFVIDGEKQNVGIGTTSPVNKLDVAGNISCSVITASFFGTSSWATNALTASYVTSSNVIGTVTSASYSLSSSFSPTTITASWATNALTASSLVVGNSYNITNLTASNISASGTGSFGMVGIGTTSPVALLSVVPSGSAFDNTNAMAAYFGKNTSSSYGSTFIRVAISHNTTTTGSSANYTDIEQNSGGSGPFRYGTYVDTNIINSNASTSGVYGSINFVTSGSARMTIAGGTSAGNVGIGTTNPDTSLSIKRNSSGYVFRAASNLPTAALMGSFERQNGSGSVTGATRFGFTSNISEIQSLTGFAFFINGTSDLNSQANGTQSLTILSTSGNVGIGTTNPGALLDVSGSSRFGFTSTNTHQFTGSVSINGSLNATSSWSTNSLTASSLVVGNSYNITNLTASNISASRTGSFGMVGVGTSSPGAILEVSSSTALTIFNVKGAGGANLFTVSGSGNIGVGTTPSTSYKMQINGSFSATTKSFDIDHPVKSGKRLVYGSLESPYHGVRLTGKGKLVKGKGVIQLPDYMNALVDYDNPNVQITNIKHNKVIYVDGIDEKNNIINIAAKIPKTQLNKELEFYWTFTAVRKDVPPLQVEC